MQTRGDKDLPNTGSPVMPRADTTSTSNVQLAPPPAPTGAFGDTTTVKAEKGTPAFGRPHRGRTAYYTKVGSRRVEYFCFGERGKPLLMLVHGAGYLKVQGWLFGRDQVLTMSVEPKLKTEERRRSFERGAETEDGGT